MAVITPSTILTGLIANYPAYFSQVKQTVIITNGINPNYTYNLLAGGAATLLGIVMDAVNVLTSVLSAGALTGEYRYRVRWFDSSTKTWSLASNELTVNPVDQQVQISKAALTAPTARADFWILERTLDGGKTFYPVNYGYAAPNGTAIGTATYTDNLSDRLLRQRTSLRNNGGIPSPYRYTYAHKNRIWLVGTQILSAAVTMTSGSAIVTSSAGNIFFTGMAGKYIQIASDTGVGNLNYKILTVDSATQITLTTNYVGTSATKTIMLFGDTNKLCWSDAGQPEHFGTQEVGGLSNEITIGAAGEKLVTAVGIGPSGELLVMESGMYLLSWTEDPDPIRGDGRLVPLPTRRGAVGPRAVKAIDNYIYGIDISGIWRMTPNGMPEDISVPLHHDFKRNSFNSCKASFWHVGYDQKKKWVKFYVSEGSDVYAKKCFVWDTQREKWIGTITYPLGVTSSTEIRDTTDHLRTAIAMETKSSAASLESHVWCDNISKTRGLTPGGTPASGTITGVGANTITIASAAFPTTGVKLKGCPVRMETALGVTQDGIVADNTATVLTLVANHTALVGETCHVGYVPAKYRTPVLDGNTPDRKKMWYEVRVPIKYKTASTQVSMKVYLDEKSTPDDDQTFALAEDGMTIAASSAIRTADPTVFVVSFPLPLNRVNRHRIQLEFFSHAASAPWEIVGPIKVLYDIDPANTPREHA